jgi:hypothetical protein
MSQVVRYVFAREGSLPVVIPGDVARSIGIVCADVSAAVERSLDFAGLVLLRLGNDAGTNLLRHWAIQHPAVLRDFDSVIAEVLAETPELITGALAS